MSVKELDSPTLGDRMKTYEIVTKQFLVPKQPVVVRIDGKAFHTYTKQKWCVKPFSEVLIKTFQQTTLKVCEEVMNVAFAYHQSDEVTFLLKDYERKEQQQLFAGNIQKISSTLASKFTAHFNFCIKLNLEQLGIDTSTLKLAEFDARVFNLPIHEVLNNFIWRQRDAIKNSVSQYASSFFSHKELHSKNTQDKLNMILESGHKEWGNLPISLQRGTVFKKEEIELPFEDLSEENIQYYISRNIEVPDTVLRKKWIIVGNTPIFSEDRNYIESIVNYSETE